MRFEDKLKKRQYDQMWSEYCGFLDLDIDGYMRIQTRLMEEQIHLWSGSALGRQILGDKQPQTIEDFRRMVKLTSYEDYADILLQKRSDMLPRYPHRLDPNHLGGRPPTRSRSRLIRAVCSKPTATIFSPA